MVWKLLSSTALHAVPCSSPPIGLHSQVGSRASVSYTQRSPLHGVISLLSRPPQRHSFEPEDTIAEPTLAAGLILA